jgi:hypothetical protein
MNRSLKGKSFRESVQSHFLTKSGKTPNLLGDSFCCENRERVSANTENHWNDRCAGVFDTRFVDLCDTE